MNTIKYLLIGSLSVSINLNLFSADQTKKLGTICLRLGHTIEYVKSESKLMQEDDAIVVTFLKNSKFPSTNTFKIKDITTNGLEKFCSYLTNSPECTPKNITFEFCNFKGVSLSPLICIFATHNTISLKELFIEGSDLEQNHVNEFAKIINLCSRLKELSFYRSNLGRLSIKPLTDAFAQNNSINHVNLANNDLDSENIKELGTALSKNSTIGSLCLMNNKINDAAFNDLAQGIMLNSFLKRLDLSMNQITMQGIEDNIDMFKKNTTLYQISFIANNLAGKDISVFAEALANNQSLNTLYLQRCKISDENIKILRTKAPQKIIAAY